MSSRRNRHSAGGRPVMFMAFALLVVAALASLRPFAGASRVPHGTPEPGVAIVEPATIPPAAPPTAPLVPDPTAAPTSTPLPTPTPRSLPLPPVRVGDAEYGQLLSDSLFLYSGDVLNFNVQAFLDAQPGPLKSYQETLDDGPWTAAAIIQYNAANFGINPQFILLALEAQASTITDPAAQVPVKNIYAGGFYTYVRALAHSALVAYDGARYGELDAHATFEDGATVELPQGLNPGTLAVQVALAKVLPLDRWAAWVQGPDPLFRARFRDWFGDPYAAPDAPTGWTMPAGWTLPFPRGEAWYYTGGPHSYDSSGKRPWSSLDFAPPEKLWCPGGPTPMERWVVAAAEGIVIESSDALVVIDHGDGWRTYYSHIATEDRVPRWKTVLAGEPIGHPSCEVEYGGSTNGVHVHFALWRAGVGFVDVTGTALSGWTVAETRHYNGTLTNPGGDVRTAENGKVDTWNDVLNPPE